MERRIERRNFEELKSKLEKVQVGESSSGQVRIVERQIITRKDQHEFWSETLLVPNA